MCFNPYERRHVAFRVRVLRNLMAARPVTQTPAGNRLSVYWYKPIRCQDVPEPSGRELCGGPPSTLDLSKVVAPLVGAPLISAPFGVAHINLEQYRED
jgi:hypothetical protein